ncbi:MAG: hypothetical protein CTY10_05715 [Methylotenera sp.]|nr:MAG: hypothetical protein CTY10_05715 [Methylotenera sp.]
MSEPIKAVQTAFDSFKRKIIEINYLQGITKSIYEKHLLELNQREKGEQDLPRKSFRNVNFLLYSIGQGKLVHCESNQFNTQEMFDLAAELFNKQYQLLLVDAYEAFKKYLEAAYVELSKANHKFYIKKFHNKINNDFYKFDSLLFLKKLHSEIPQINIIIDIRNEQDHRQPNHDRTLFLIALIEKLRHHVVHTNGFVIDKQKSISDVFQKIGLTKNQNYVDEFNYYFGINKHSNRICLLEVYDSLSPQVLNTYNDRFNNLIRMLISYTSFVNGYIINQLK